MIASVESFEILPAPTFTICLSSPAFPTETTDFTLEAAYSNSFPLIVVFSTSFAFCVSEPLPIATLLLCIAFAPSPIAIALIPLFSTVAM